MSTRNKLLESIVLALGGTVTNPNNRNQLLYDWLAAKGGVPPQTRYVYNFNGVNSYIDVGSIVYSGDYSRSVKFIMPALSGNTVRVWGNDIGFNSRLLVSADGSANIRFSDSDNAGVNIPAGAFSTGVTYAVTVSRTGSSATVNVNGTDFNFSGVSVDQSTFNYIQRQSSASYGVGVVFDYTDSLGNNYPINDRTFGAGAVIANTGIGTDATGVNLLESGWEEIPL